MRCYIGDLKDCYFILIYLIDVLNFFKLVPLSSDSCVSYPITPSHPLIMVLEIHYIITCTKDLFFPTCTWYNSLKYNYEPIYLKTHVLQYLYVAMLSFMYTSWQVSDGMSCFYQGKWHSSHLFAIICRQVNVCSVPFRINSPSWGVS